MNGRKALGLKGAKARLTSLKFILKFRLLVHKPLLLLLCLPKLPLQNFVFRREWTRHNLLLCRCFLLRPCWWSTGLFGRQVLRGVCRRWRIILRTTSALVFRGLLRRASLAFDRRL